MATSGTTIFSISRDDIIKGALRKIGVVAQGETPSTDQYTEAAFALNLLVKSWEADGMPLWALRTTAIPLTADVNAYTIGVSQTVNTDKPLKVIQAWNRNTTSNIDVPMRILTKQEYNILGNKTTTGNPIQIYYEPLRDTGVLHVFPTPSSTDAAAQQIYIVYQRPYEDFNISTDTPDFPQEWYDAVLYGLAVRLAPEYGVPIDQRQVLGREAADIKLAALSFGTEEGSVYFQKEYRDW
jgi:hypothetical protein